jgi:lipopolysaccharide heptosyltransferase II
MSLVRSVFSLFSLIHLVLIRVRRFCWSLFIAGVELAFRAPSNAAEGDCKNACRILIVRLDGIGDLVLNTSVLRELRKARPEAEITLLIPERGRNLYETCPYVDELLIVDPILEKRRNPLQSFFSARTYWRGQAKRDFDIALSPRLGLNPYLAFMLYFSGAPVRLGYSERLDWELGSWKRFADEGLNLDRLLTRSIPDVKPQHEVLNSLAILEPLGISPSDSKPELWLRPCDHEFAQTACRFEDSENTKPLVGIGVGAGVPKRVWPMERQAVIAAWLIDAYGARIVLLGGPDDAEAAAAIAAQIGSMAVNLAGSATLRQAAAVVEACTVLLTHDTSLLHIASAVGTPVVEISCHPRTGSPRHSNAPERFGPWCVPHRILRPDRPRPPCVNGCRDERQAHCILEIGTNAVEEAIAELIEEQYGWKPNRERSATMHRRRT